MLHLKPEEPIAKSIQPQTEKSINDNGYGYDITYPILIMEGNPTIAEKINASIKEFIDELKVDDYTKHRKHVMYEVKSWSDGLYHIEFYISSTRQGEDDSETDVVSKSYSLETGESN
ncbi:hypothetical protein CIB95_08675 [Lottiidibacillus patelloidae]|uniref:Uncharacterized protein n=1 Tax=Lottiidibacillus patelloidae TaxID=2670334 RepID=A0A263BUH8_9BACI|nr:hypothetical protein [Lottiidibacillus patelloidae]OZM56836.1 hypothetical protein CIB95_08675 [Lottiidibacillus patelloidae]